MTEHMRDFLAPWAAAQLNLIQSIALEMDRRGLRPADVAAAAAAALEGLVTFGTPSVTPRSNQPPKSMPACPQCGAAMLPVANTEGLHIIGCRKCRYSRLEG